MFEEILKELKTKYKDLGLSEVYLKVVAKRLAKTVKEETEIEGAVAELEDELKYQQSQNDLLRTLKSQVEKMEKGEKGGNVNPDKKDGDEKGKEESNPNEDVPGWAKVLTTGYEALTAEIKGLKEEKTNQSNSQKLISKLKDLGANEDFYALLIEDKTFQNDEEIEVFAVSIKEKEDAYLQNLKNKGLVKSAGGGQSGSGDGEGKVSADVQAFVKDKYEQQ